MVRRFHLVMRYIEANDLKKSSFDPWDMVKQGLRLLQYLQSFTPPILHRDIKPSNLLWTQNGTLMLIDFGAAVRGERGTLGHTIMTGTVGYQSPEQIYGEPQIASDLYSLGVVLVEILAGRTAFSMLEGQQLHWEEHISVPPIAILWLRRMLHPDVDMRFVSAEEALYELEPVLAALSHTTTERKKDSSWLQLFAQPASKETKEKWKGWVLLKEKAAKGAEWEFIAHCWRLLDEPDAFHRANERAKKYFRALLSERNEKALSLGLAVKLPEQASLIQIKSLYETLEEDMILLQKIHQDPSLTRIKQKLPILRAKHTEEELTGLCSFMESHLSSQEHTALANLYQKHKFPLRVLVLRQKQEEQRQQEAIDITRELARFGISVQLDPPRLAILEEARTRLQHQQELHERAEALKQTFAQHGLQWLPPVQPYSKFEIDRIAAQVEQRSYLEEQWTELQERAHKIDWTPKTALLSPIALEAFQVALDQQEAYHARICAAEVRAKKSLEWAPKKPKPPYAEPEAYEKRVQEQLEFHAQVQVHYDALSRAVRRIIKKPKPPYSSYKVEQFLSQAQELSTNRLAEDILRYRKIAFLFLVLIVMGSYFGSQQWKLAQQVQELRASHMDVANSFPHPSCSTCGKVFWPSFPYNQHAINSFSSILSTHIQTKKKVHALYEEAIQAQIEVHDIVVAPTEEVLLALESRLRTQLVSPQDFYLLRRNAERLYIDTKTWKLPIHQRAFKIRKEEVAQAQKLFDDAQALQENLKVPIPFVYPLQRAQVEEWRRRVRQIPKVQALFAKQGKLKMSRPFSRTVLGREISQELFTMVMDYNPSFLQDSARSVHKVTWFETLAFANRLNWYLQEPPCYILTENDVRWKSDCSSWRLPTKEEWFTLAKNKKRGRTWESGSVSFPRSGRFYGDLWEFVWDRNEEPLMGARPYVVGGSWLSPQKHILKTVDLQYKAENISFRLVRGGTPANIEQPDQVRRPYFNVEQYSLEQRLVLGAYRLILLQNEQPEVARQLAEYLEEKGLLAEAEIFYARSGARMCLPLQNRRIIRRDCDLFLPEQTFGETKEKSGLLLLRKQSLEAIEALRICSKEDISCLYTRLQLLVKNGRTQEARAIFCDLLPSQQKNTGMQLSCQDL